jgi:hypothetical protein
VVGVAWSGGAELGDEDPFVNAVVGDAHYFPLSGMFETAITKFRFL